MISQDGDVGASVIVSFSRTEYALRNRLLLVENGDRVRTQIFPARYSENFDSYNEIDMIA